MDFAGLASTKLSEVLRPKSVGEPVNAHVVPATKEPRPDFDKMQRIISGTYPVNQTGAPERDQD